MGKNRQKANLTSNNLITSDITNDRIGINSTSPTTTLDVGGTVTATTIIKSGGTSSQFLKADGSVDSSTYLTSYTETDPVVAAINGIVKSNGTTISAATAGHDYLTPSGDGSSLTGVLSDVVEDTTPQLGGDLDLNSNDITGTGNIDITGTLDVSGIATFQSHVKLGDNSNLKIGAGDDLELYHNSITNESIIKETGGSNFLIQGTNLHLQSASGEDYFVGTLDGSAELYYDNSKKLETTSTGVTITGTASATEFSGGGSNLTGLTGASAATYGDASNVAQVVVDANGRITGISEVAITGGGSVSEAFKTIAVSGQSDVVADSATDTLTLVAGSNMTITTNASGDSITFASSGGGGGGGSGISAGKSIALAMIFG